MDNLYHSPTSDDEAQSKLFIRGRKHKNVAFTLCVSVILLLLSLVVFTASPYIQALGNLASLRQSRYGGHSGLVFNGIYCGILLITLLFYISALTNFHAKHKRIFTLMTTANILALVCAILCFLDLSVVLTGVENDSRTPLLRGSIIIGPAGMAIDAIIIQMLTVRSRAFQHYYFSGSI